MFILPLHTLTHVHAHIHAHTHTRTHTHTRIHAHTKARDSGSLPGATEVILREDKLHAFRNKGGDITHDMHQIMKVVEGKCYHAVLILLHQISRRKKRERGLTNFGR